MRSLWQTGLVMGLLVLAGAAFAAESDSREHYGHGGAHNFNPATKHGSKAIDTENKDKFRSDLSTFKDPRAVSENYEYQTNREDIIARHTFVLAGADRKLGHHVAFFESRHQHHALVKLEFDFTGAGLKPGTFNPADLKAGKAIFETRILKDAPPQLRKGEYYAVQVSPLNPEFELVTIPTGVTRLFLGSLSTITSEGKVTRFNQKGSDVIVKITDVHHFSRMYVKEAPSDLQYLSFVSEPAKNSYVLVHVIQGRLPNAPNNDALNTEQMMEATVLEPAGYQIKEGSLLKLENRGAGELLKLGDTVEATVLREGGESAAPSSPIVLKFKVGKDLYTRQVGIDPSQEAIRKRVRGN